MLAPRVLSQAPGSLRATRVRRGTRCAWVTCATFGKWLYGADAATGATHITREHQGSARPAPRSRGRRSGHGPRGQEGRRREGDGLRHVRADLAQTHNGHGRLERDHHSLMGAISHRVTGASGGLTSETYARGWTRLSATLWLECHADRVRRPGSHYRRPTCAWL